MKMVYIACALMLWLGTFAAAFAVERGDIEAHGTKFIWSGTGQAFIPNYVMYGTNVGTMLDDITEADWEAFLDEMIDGHGFNGVHYQVYGQWFNIGTHTVSSNDYTIDPRTFDKLEMMITKAYARGAAVHLWMWGDAARNKEAPTPMAPTLHQAEKDICDALYERLNHLPGWTLGYGFDLFEWTNEAHLKAWRDYCHAKPDWKPLLGARAYKNEVSQIFGGLDYSSYENHKPDYALYRQLVEHHPTKPSFSEDRFRIRGRSKDVTPEEARQMMWWASMAGGVAGIWGYLGSEEGVSQTFPNKDLILCYNRFWHTGQRFRKDMVVDNSITDGYALREGNSHYVFLKENTSSIQVSFSGADKRVIAVDAKAAYQEIDLGIMSSGAHVLTLPRQSDWAIAVGDFTAGSAPENDPPVITSATVDTPIVTGKTAQLRVDAVDPDGDAMTYTWAASPGSGATIGAGEDPTVTFSQAGVYTFTVSVTDGNHPAVVSDPITVTVQQVATSLSIQP